ncbi:unnamed protein product, partial [Ectocarpus sp. 12 AP-2014]
MTVGRLSREYLTLLGLPYESISGMFQKDSWTVKNGNAMVDGIQLGRVFTMFEKEEVRDNLVPIVPTIDRLGESRQQSSRAASSAAGARGGGGGGGGRIVATPPPLDGPRPRPQTTIPIPGETATRYRSHRSGYSSASPSPHALRRGALLSLGQEDSEEVGRAWNRNSNYYLHHNHDDQKNQA